ncbi:MAG: 3'(2'),5'-bisphosphate nucleotidase CysQ [Spirochaetes bacterium]|nr:3'(2'),5'-bisphosphate nucleotidase CysQ [Spirochaetota bacterium]
MDLKKELDTCKEISVKAGKEILKYYDNIIDVEYKSDKSPLTAADKRSNEIILNELLDKFNKYAILTEESEDDKSRLDNEWCWIIDPLDGTKEFIKKNGEFTVNISLCYENNIVLGVIYSPVSEELFYATKNSGSFCEKNNTVNRIFVSDRLDNLRLVKSRSHSGIEMEMFIAKNKQRISEVKDSGSSIKGCLIAKGDAEVYYRFRPLSEWDIAAMHCIVEEAGAIVRQLDDSRIVFNKPECLVNNGFYVLNNIKNKLII